MSDLAVFGRFDRFCPLLAEVRIVWSRESGVRSQGTLVHITLEDVAGSLLSKAGQRPTNVQPTLYLVRDDHAVSIPLTGSK
jgi:hypothetical protein